MSRVADRGSCSNADTEHNVGGDDPLTTKEGWRRFVDHQSQPPGLYAAAELARVSPGERPPRTRAATATTPTCLWSTSDNPKGDQPRRAY